MLSLKMNGPFEFDVESGKEYILAVSNGTTQTPTNGNGYTFTLAVQPEAPAAPEGSRENPLVYTITEEKFIIDLAKGQFYTTSKGKSAYAFWYKFIPEYNFTGTLSFSAPIFSAGTEGTNSGATIALYDGSESELWNLGMTTDKPKKSGSKSSLAFNQGEEYLININIYTKSSTFNLTTENTLTITVDSLR